MGNKDETQNQALSKGRRAIAIRVAVGMCILLLGIWNQSGRWFPHAYAAPEIKAKILDAVTKRPLEGVLVVAFWEDEGWGLHLPSLVSDGGPSPDCSELVNVATATTGSDGGFVIPAWSGKSGHCRHLSPFTPHLILFKPGYAELELAHSREDPFWFDPSLFSSDYLYGGDIMMQPLGPHYFGMDYDSHVENLVHYSQDLEGLLNQQDPSRCFWSESRPALLLLLSEEHRLANYMQPGLKLFEGDLKTATKSGDSKWSCGDQTPYLAQLESQVAGTSAVEAPPLHLTDIESKPRDAFDSELLDRLQKSVDAPSKSTVGAADSLEYDVKLDPDNPMYLKVMAVFPLDKNPAQSPGIYVDGWRPLDDRMYDKSCETLRPRNRNFKSGKSATRAICHWVSAVVPTRRSNYWTSHYDDASGCWYLTGDVIRRPSSTSLTEIFHVYSDRKLSFATMLPPANKDTWTLWAEKVPFVVRVRVTSNNKDSAGIAGCPGDT